MVRNAVNWSNLCTYTYAETSYAHPHAVTSAGGTTYAYDNNGNVTAIGSLDYTWDWRNRLASAERSGGGVTSYGYDHTGQRVFQATGSATTSYPSRYYNVASSSLTATTTKHIFAPDGTLLATVVGASTTATTTYLHSDHLGGTNVATDEDGEVTQTLDYYPYGSQRINSGSSNEQRRFIGEEFDSDTEFSYLNARYYQGSRGQFMSQDPVFVNLGVDRRTKVLLADPQQQNSYSYSRNNPVTWKDPQGEFVLEAIGVLLIALYSSEAWLNWSYTSRDKGASDFDKQSSWVGGPGMESGGVIAAGEAARGGGAIAGTAVGHALVIVDAWDQVRIETEKLKYFSKNSNVRSATPWYGRDNISGGLQTLFPSITQFVQSVGGNAGPPSPGSLPPPPPPPPPPGSFPSTGGGSGGVYIRGIGLLPPPPPPPPPPSRR